MTSKAFDGMTYEEWTAKIRVEDEQRWKESGSDLTFEDWRQQDIERRNQEREAERVAEARQQAHKDRVAALAKYIPTRYATAETDEPQLLQWVARLRAWSNQVRQSDAGRRRQQSTVVDWYPEPQRDPLELDIVAPEPGPSLLLLGPTGVGKTHAAFGALRRYVADGGTAPITAAAAADLYATLRPRTGVDSEEQFGRYATTPILFIDDLGAAKTSPWVEEINYRLINYRYNHQLATLFTSNVPTKELGEYLGERVASRIVGMADTVVLKGDDRRRRAA